MSGFAPSVEAARVALGASIPIEMRDHPNGAQGAQVSLDEVAARVRKGRLDPRVRAWAIRAVKEDGEPRSAKGQAQSILKALRKATTYVQDAVNAEFMQAAHETLCLDNHGLCFKGGDCDDLVIAYASAVMSIGLPAKVVGQSFDASGVPTHVIAAVQDTKTKEWFRVDPSSSNKDVGQAFPATKEQWIDPMDIAVPGQSLSGGDFVGVGRHPGLLGALPFARPDSKHFHSLVMKNVYLTRERSVGVGDIPTTLTDQQRQVIFDVATSQIQSAVYTLEVSTNDLRAAFDSVEQARRLLRPENPYDPEPPGGITSLASAPIGGVWTKSMSNMSSSLLTLGDTLVAAGHEALNGVRRILIDQKSGLSYVEAKDSDPWSLRTVYETATDSILGYFNKAGALLGGFTEKAGRILTPTQITQEQKSGTIQGVGVGVLPIILGIIAIIGIAICVVTDYFKTAKLADTAVALAKEANTKTVLDLLASGKLTPEQTASILQTVSQARVNEAKANAENKKADPFAKIVENIGSIVMWTAIGGATVAGIVVLTPLIRTALEEATAKRRQAATRTEAAPMLPMAAERW